MVLPLLSVGFVGALFGCRPGPRAVMSEEEARALYTKLRPVPDKGRSVFHLGHSLVGRDMPAMLSQLAKAGHVSHSQLGWGTSLKSHWDDEIAGFETENDHPAARRAAPSIDGGTYDAVVFTEMVEIRAAIQYYKSAEYLHRWARRAQSANPNAELFFYESWPNIDDEEGWLERVDADLKRHWEDEILFPAVRALAAPVYMIPGGQALAATIRSVMAQGSVDGVTSIEDFFAIAPDGSQDNIHFNDLGAYVIALTHYTVLYKADPRGLPHRLQRADGSDAVAPGATLAALMQQSVWDVATSYELTGISA